MDPLSIASLGLGLGQTLAGIFNKPKRPKYNIPGEAYQSLSTAKMLSNSTTRPGDAQAVSQINQDAANATAGAQRVTDNQAQLLAANDRAGFMKTRNMLQNNALNSNFQYNAKLNLQNALNNFAQQRDKAFQINKMQPYMNKAETSGALISSGIQNVFGVAQDQNNMNMMRDIYGLPKPQGLGSIFKKKPATPFTPITE